MTDPTTSVPEPEATPSPELPTVHQAIARVMAEIPSIGKDQESKPSKEGGPKYRYRGIEAITAHLQPLLAKHGVVIYPQTELLNVLTWGDINMRDGWREHVIEVKWGVFGPRGDCLDPPPRTWGQGRDNADKGVNKAQTQAYKYLLLQLFAIGDRNDDADQGPPSDDQYQPAGTTAASDDPNRYLTNEQLAPYRARIGALAGDLREELMAEWMREDPTTGDPWLPVEEGRPSTRLLTRGHLTSVEGLIARYEARQATAETAPEAGPPAADRPGQVLPAPAAQGVANEDLGKATTSNEIIGVIRSMTVAECQAELLVRGTMPDPSWGEVRLRAELADLVHGANGVPLPNGGNGLVNPDGKPDVAIPDDPEPGVAPHPDQD